MENKNIAVDGPAGAGKSTIARRVGAELGYVYVDTGAMYRAMAFFMMKTHIDANEEAAVARACKDADITIQYQNGKQQILLNGENITDQIRTEEIGNMASLVAKNQEVRKKLVELQQKLAKNENVIMDGRDIGTVVLKDAKVKIFLTASSAERAKRRHLELAERGIESCLEEIEADIKSRDTADMNRVISPLKQAEDAILVDCSDMNIQEVIDRIVEIYHNKVRDNH